LPAFELSNGSVPAGTSSPDWNTVNETSTTGGVIPDTGFYYVTMQASQYMKNIDSGYLQIGEEMGTPKTTTNGSMILNETIWGISITSNVQSLGTFTNATGPHPVTGMTSAQNVLSTFSPTFNWKSVINDGYTVAVSQSLQNLTTQQSAVSTGSYVEQVEYQGSFALPTAPDLSYGAANLTEHFNVSTAQVQVLDINGVSYLSAISGKNGTIQLLSSVNPNGQTQFLQIVDYTQSQWTSISSPPGIFTIQGIEYYWEEFIIAILAVVGIGAGAASKHASSLRKVK
jgi:hypothetical protein